MFNPFDLLNPAKLMSGQMEDMQTMEIPIDPTTAKTPLQARFMKAIKRQLELTPMPAMVESLLPIMATLLFDNLTDDAIYKLIDRVQEELDYVEGGVDFEDLHRD